MRRFTFRQALTRLTVAAVCALMLCAFALPRPRTLLAQGIDKKAEACKTIQTALDNLRETLKTTKQDLSDRQRELNVLDLLIARMNGQSMAKADLTRAMDTASGNEVVSPALKAWASGLSTLVTVQTVAGQKASTQTKVNDLGTQARAGDEQVRQLRQKQFEMNCDVSDSGGGGDTPGPGPGPTPPVTPGPGPGPGPGPIPGPPPGPGGDPADAGMTPADWAGEWAHDFGIMSLTLDDHADQLVYLADEVLGRDDVRGPKVTCDRKAVYRGDIQWDRAGAGFAQNYRAKVFACTNGLSLEGKFSNYGEGTTVQSASFRIDAKTDDKRQFDGAFRVFTPSPPPGRTGAPVSWQGRKR